MSLKQQSSTTYVSVPKPSFDCDVAIVGGGIVGVTLACALKNSGIDVILIEAQSKEAAASKKQAYALSLQSGHIFSLIGVWQQIFADISKFRHIRISDANHAGVVKFETKDLGKDFLGYVGEHRVILTALQEFIADSANVRWLSCAEVLDIDRQESGAAIAVRVDGQERTLKTKLIVGADGARSHVRNWAGIKTRGWKYWQSCVVFTVKHQAPQNDIAFERFWPSGPMGILPLPGNRCQIVWTNPHTEAKALQKMDERDFLAKLEQYTGELLGKLELASERFLFPVQLMQSDRYVQSRLALIGDAAHCCHPVGGQGLNLGIRDAAALAQILRQAHTQQEDLGNLQVLKRYESWRKQENLAILGFTDFLDRMFSNNLLPVIIIRRFGLWLMEYLPPLKVYFLKLMTGLRGKSPQIN